MISTYEAAADERMAKSDASTYKIVFPVISCL